MRARLGHYHQGQYINFAHNILGWGVCVCVCVCQSFSRPLRAHGLWPARFFHPWDFPGKNTAMDCHSFLQGIFPTQGSNPGLPYCRQILYHLSHQGSLQEGRSTIYQISTGCCVTVLCVCLAIFFFFTAVLYGSVWVGRCVCMRERDKQGQTELSQVFKRENQASMTLK